MKIININRFGGVVNPEIETAVNLTLESGSYNESLYNQYVVDVTVKCESKKDKILLLYSKAYWISIGKGKGIFNNGDDTYSFCMSLMNAIDFIYEATPPLLQSEIKSSITSVDNIIDVMKTYLLENNPDLQLRISIFLKKNGLYDYGGIWNDSNNRTELIRSILDKNNVTTTFAYVDAQCDGFVQYIVSGPVTNIDNIFKLVDGLWLTHVHVNESKSITGPDIINIKGYITHHDDVNTSLSYLCDKTLKLLE